MSTWPNCPITGFLAAATHDGGGALGPVYNYAEYLQRPLPNNRWVQIAQRWPYGCPACLAKLHLTQTTPVDDPTG